MSRANIEKLASAKLLVGATAIDLLKQDNRLLRRQVRILRAELRAQEQMWKDAEAGKRALRKVVKHGLARDVQVSTGFCASGRANARHALDCATRAAKGQRNPPVTDKNFKRIRRR